MFQLPDQRLVMHYLLHDIDHTCWRLFQKRVMHT